jgi:hypothetical protein
MRFIGYGAAVLLSVTLAMPVMAQTATGTTGMNSNGTAAGTMSNGSINAGSAINHGSAAGTYGCTSGTADCTRTNPLTAPHSGGGDSNGAGGGGTGSK